jgi:hypothetical protein
MEQCKPFSAVKAAGRTCVGIVLPVSIQPGELWNSRCGHFEKYMVVLNPNAFIAYRDCGGYGRPTPHERVEYDSCAQGQ